MCLEPKVTLSTGHNVVEVTAPDSSQFMVDPSYIQFHKDICLNDALLPTFPVLVLGEAEIDDYIEQKIMAQWKKNVKLFEEEDSSTIQEIANRDQWIPYNVESIGLPKEMVPEDVDAWIRDAFKRVWVVTDHFPFTLIETTEGVVVFAAWIKGLEMVSIT